MQNLRNIWNHTSRKRQFKTGVPQGGVLSPTLINIYTPDLPQPSSPVQVMAYADDITILSTHTSMSAVKEYIQPYIQKVFSWTKQSHTKSIHLIESRTGRGNVARVNQSCLTANIWLRAELNLYCYSRAI